MTDEFPLKVLRAVLKDSKKYMDIAHIEKDGSIAGRVDEGGLGEIIVFPIKADKLIPIAPIKFRVAEFMEVTKDLKAKEITWERSSKNLYIHNVDNSTLSFDIPEKEFKYPLFVKHVWKHLGNYNFRKLTDTEMQLLYAYNVVEMDAYYKNPDEESIQIILSGKDFNLSKSLEAIYVAAVDIETPYQKSCSHRHVVTRIQYSTCDVYMLCGVI